MTRTARAACPTCARSTAIYFGTGVDLILRAHLHATTGKRCPSSSRALSAELARVAHAAVTA